MFNAETELLKIFWKLYVNKSLDCFFFQNKNS